MASILPRPQYIIKQYLDTTGTCEAEFIWGNIMKCLFFLDTVIMQVFGTFPFDLHGQLEKNIFGFNTTKVDKLWVEVWMRHIIKNNW